MWGHLDGTDFESITYVAATKGSLITIGFYFHFTLCQEVNLMVMNDEDKPNYPLAPLLSGEDNVDG